MSQNAIGDLFDFKDASGESSSWRSASVNILPPMILLALIVIAWEAAVDVFRVSAFIIPAPSAIAKSLYVDRETLIEASIVTAYEICLGFVVSLIAGVALALVIARFDWLGRALYPLVVLFQNVPKVALAPIFILWFGYGLAPKIGLILVIAFFPVTLSMLAGMEAVDPSLLALMQSVGASPTQILFRIRVPHSLPSLMAGMKIAVTLSVIGAIVGEFAGASDGLGYVIQFASTQLETPLVFAALALVSLLGIAFYYLAEWVERFTVPWAPKFSSR